MTLSPTFLHTRAHIFLVDDEPWRKLEIFRRSLYVYPSAPFLNHSHGHIGARSRLTIPQIVGLLSLRDRRCTMYAGVRWCGNHKFR